MADVLFLAILIAFFSLAVVFVHACDRIIGPDLEAEANGTVSESEPAGGMTGIESVIGLTLSALVAAYLVYALLFPEKL